MSKKVYGTQRWKELRLRVLQEQPVCHWCQQRESTQADHLIPLVVIEEQGGDPYDRENLVGSCAQCNAHRGSKLGNQRKKQKKEFFKDTPPLPRLSPPQNLSQISEASPNFDENEPKLYEPGRIPARLSTPKHGTSSLGSEVVEWASDHLGIELYPWQAEFLEGALEVDDSGKLLHRYSLASCARQQGKTALLASIVGYWLTVGRVRWGSPITVLSVAHMISTAELLAIDPSHGLFTILEERYGYKTYVSSGRMMVTHDDGSWWRIQSSSPKAGHGLSVDLLIVDELHAVNETVVNGGLLPTQRSRAMPFSIFTSTAGDESSAALINWRERGMRAIEKGEPGRLHFAEWSPPPNIEIGDRRYWHMANPALDLGYLTWQDLEDEYGSPDKQQFIQYTLNMWTAAIGSWLPVGAFDKLETSDEMPDGGILAVDSDSDGSCYVGVRAALRDDGNVQLRSEFRVESLFELWDEIRKQDSKTKLTLTPGLQSVAPLDIQRNSDLWGSREMTQYTAIVRGLILEEKIRHCGQVSLAEHINRAVAGKNRNGTITLTSIRSPGAIELARCAVAATGKVIGTPAKQRPKFVTSK